MKRVDSILFAWLLTFAGAVYAADTAEALLPTVVNINTADAATLAVMLDGVGESRANAIVEYRKANGPFETADELVEVKGIGKAVVEKNRGRITVK
jgi:competence protein ComEA